jgi:hypothetical protein
MWHYTDGDGIVNIFRLLRTFFRSLCISGSTAYFLPVDLVCLKIKSYLCSSGGHSLCDH